jgi:hypothetical protein
MMRHASVGYQDDFRLGLMTSMQSTIAKLDAAVGRASGRDFGTDARLLPPSPAA